MASKSTAKWAVRGFVALKRQHPDLTDGEVLRTLVEDRWRKAEPEATDFALRMLDDSSCLATVFSAVMAKTGTLRTFADLSWALWDLHKLAQKYELDMDIVLDPSAKERPEDLLDRHWRASLR